jgi:hypothetical protein
MSKHLDVIGQNIKASAELAINEQVKMVADEMRITSYRKTKALKKVSYASREREVRERMY